MAIKKSELYSSLWAGCDELRGGMDASQYKDYVLVMLFIKYISDKWAGQPYSPITIPEGASFADMVKLKGNSDIGGLINTKILAPLEEANLQVSYPFKTRLELPIFPEYPISMDWQYNQALKLWTLPDTDMDKLIHWRIAVESYPEKVKIVYEYFTKDVF